MISAYWKTHLHTILQPLDLRDIYNADLGFFQVIPKKKMKLKPKNAPEVRVKGILFHVISF